MDPIGTFTFGKYSITIGQLKAYFIEATEGYPQGREIMDSLSDEDWMNILKGQIEEMDEALTDGAIRTMKQMRKAQHLKWSMEEALAEQER